MKTNILTNNTIMKNIAKYATVIVMLFSLSLGQMWGTTIAQWAKAAIPTSNGPIPGAGNHDGNNGTAEIICNYALNTAGTYCYYGTSNSARVITIRNLTLTGYKNIKISFYSRASQQGTLTATYTANGTNWYNIVGNTATLTKSEAQYTIEGIPSEAVSIKLTHDKAKSGASFYFGTVVISGDKISTGECTAGMANGIAPGDVLVVYNTTGSKEMSAFSSTNHCVDATTYSGTPAGAYPLTVEAGNSTGTLSFKTPENKYLRMTSGGNNKLELSTTKDNASSWTVTISGGVANIVNKSYTGYALRYNNSDNDRFSSYGTGSMSQVNFYRYCAPSAFHVTYDANTTDPSVANMPTDDEDYDDGDDVSIPNTTPTRTGYTFYRWYTNEECTTPASGYAVNTSNAFQIDGADVTLYAKWTPNPYNLAVLAVGHATIKATPSGGSDITEGNNADVDCGKTVTLNYSSVDDNYTFTNWVIKKASDDSDVSGSVSLSSTTANNATFVMPAYAVKVSAVITAPWIYFTSCSSVLTVTYNANGGTGNVPVDANEYAKNDNVTVLGNVGTPSTLSKDGYTFGGWQAGGVGDVYEAGDSYTITSNTTFYAVWTPNNYKITSISTNPASSGTVTATYNAATVVAGTTEIPCGSEVTLSQEANRDKTFTSWTIKNASTSADVTATYLDGNTLTMPPFNCTVTANYSAKSSCVVTFSLENGTISTTTISGTDYTTEVTLYEGESITTLPTVGSISCGDWGTVVGWTTNSSYSESSTPPTYITAPYNPGSNTKVYAVYRKTAGSADFDGTNDGTYKVRGGGSSGASDNYATGSCGSSSYSSTTTKASGTSFTFTKNATHTSYYNISCGDGTYITCTSNDTPLGTTTSDHINDDAALWAPSQVGSNGGSGSGFWIFNNKGTTSRDFAYDGRYSQQKFMAVSHGNVTNTGADYYPIKLESASTSYYSINPVCGTTYDITKGSCTPNNTVLDASSHYCDFSLSTTSVSSGGSVTVTLTPNDDYTYNASSVTITGGGSASIGNITETAGVITCNITGITADMTVNVTYVARPKYTVTLYDNGVQRTTLTEEHYNAGVTLPSGNNCTPGSSFTFEGWTESAVELNADPVRPATLHAAGSYVPTSDITLYSVYSKSVAGCDDFAAGVSGAYKFTDKASSKYALVTANEHRYDKGSSGTAEVFYVAYTPAHSAYTIRTSLGYLGWQGGVGSEELTKNNSTPYYWTIREGTGTAAGYWQFKPVGVSGKQFSGNNTYFNIHSDATAYFIKLDKIAMKYYYNTAICEESKITFHDGGGTISGTPTTPTGASWNSGTHVLSGLEDCDKITTFPTASYDGWTFIGWSTEDYSNSGKHTADYAEENASTDEPDGSEIYKTGGNSYVVRGGSIDLYPIFTRFPENETFDLSQSEIDAYIYYMAPGTDDGYGANKRVYATAYDGEKRYVHTTNCEAATKFKFEKQLSGKWTIKDLTSNKYLVDKNDDWLCQQASTSGAEWTITLSSGNQFDAYCNYETYHIIAWDNGTGASEARFQNYNKVGLVNTPSEYHRIYLGSCTERIFSSEPNPTPTIDLTGEPYVTATNGQEIRATATMTVSAAHLSSLPADKVIVSGGSGLRFATTANATPTNTVSLTLTSGNLAATTIYVYYNPSATEDGLENIVVTAKAYNNTTDKKFQTTGTVHARHLPANFVIAAKWGDLWYALPNTCTSDGSSTTGVVITVDNDNDPTAATAAPSTAKWGLRKTKAGSRVDGSHNDRMVFTERATATANNQQALYNYNSADVYANATYENYNNTNPTRYEWIPVSSDFKDYTLTNASESKPLILRNDGDFKAQTTNQAYGGKVRLLPATFYTEAPMQVIEWKASSVLVMYTGSGVTATTKVGSAVEGSAQTLTAKKIDHGVFELTTGSLTSAANKQLIITIKNGSSAVVCRKAFVVPAIINTSGKTADYVVSGADDAEKIANAARTDVVILDGGVLSAVATKYTFKDITVYPGGKLVIGKTDKQLGMRSLTLRGGSSWGAASYEHKYPQFIVNNATDGAYSNTAVKINYDYVTTKAQYYTFVLPYTGNTSTIKYPVDIYGSAVAANNTGSFEFQCYNGSARAAGGSGWATLAEPADLVAGRGYTFLGMPKKVDAYNGTDDSHSTTRQTYGIHRIPMSVSAATVQSGETNSSPGKSTPISVTLADKNNASGWVLVGNPFMGDVTGLDNDDIQVGNLIHSDTNPWDGKWRWNPESSQRFVVIPGPDGTTYESEEVSTAELPAFKNFFVQIKSSSVTSLVIPASSRDDAALAPARFTAQEEKDIRLAVDLVSDTRSDKVDLLINDAYSAEFDEDADFTKMMNGTNLNLYGVYPGDNLSFIAVDKATAAGSIAIGYQVPAAGEYTLQLSDRAYVMADALEALYVTDHEVSPEITTDLLDGPYNFHVNNAETNNTRFTMSIRLAPKTPTDIEVVIPDELKDSGALKFIYQDKMYILRNGVIYDATGKKVREINR